MTLGVLRWSTTHREFGGEWVGDEDTRQSGSDESRREPSGDPQRTRENGLTPSPTGSYVRPAFLNQSQGMTALRTITPSATG